MKLEDLPAELQRVLRERVPERALADRAAAFAGSMGVGHDDKPSGMPMSVPGDGGHSWDDARRLLTVDEDRHREFRRRVDVALDAWRDDHPGLLIPDATRTDLIENTRFWMQRQLREWQAVLDDHRL